jgi:proline racemase/trans-L-3-hydroxyproline dehydratase
MPRLVVSATDYHTAGEPFRIVSGGVGPIPGATILEKRRHCAERLDHVRRLLVHEPRGHADMYGCFVTEPCAPGSDLGVVFFHNAGYSTACGHGTIALATWAVESGVVEQKDRLRIDVPSGTVEVELRDGEAAFRNVPAFVHLRGVDAAGLEVDVAYGGAFYASVESPVTVEPAHLPELIELGRRVKRELEAAHEIVHPGEPEIGRVYGVVFWRREGERVQRNVTVFADGEVDRSPCGSGTSARLALLDADGELPRGETLRHLSVVGSEFRGRVVGETEEGVLTEIAGSAHLTGFHTFVLEPDDELGDGFLLR